MESKEANDLFEAGHREACLGLDRRPEHQILLEVEWLRQEVARLKRGEFTEEEFQNLCHRLTAEDACKFARGCVKYNWSLFGDRCRLQMVPDVPRVRRDD